MQSGKIRRLPIEKQAEKSLYITFLALLEWLKNVEHFLGVKSTLNRISKPSKQNLSQIWVAQECRDLNEKGIKFEEIY